jgi:hypothetical protein
LTDFVAGPGFYDDAGPMRHATHGDVGNGKRPPISTVVASSVTRRLELQSSALEFVK